MRQSSSDVIVDGSGSLDLTDLQSAGSRSTGLTLFAVQRDRQHRCKGIRPLLGHRPTEQLWIGTLRLSDGQQWRCDLHCGRCLHAGRSLRLHFRLLSVRQPDFCEPGFDVTRRRVRQLCLDLRERGGRGRPHPPRPAAALGACRPPSCLRAAARRRPARPRPHRACKSGPARGAHTAPMWWVRR